MKIYFIVGFLVFLLACDQKNPQSTKDKFDAIENIVGTANWQLINGNDTSYIYFSRMGDMNFNVYDYILTNGDSTNSRMNNIIARQDSIIWNRGNQEWLLQKVTDSAIVWQKKENEKELYIIKQNDSLHLTLIFPDSHQAILKRTLPLATFLVRSHYDFIHGTQTVDSPIIPPRRRIKK